MRVLWLLFSLIFVVGSVWGGSFVFRQVGRLPPLYRRSLVPWARASSADTRIAVHKRAAALSANAFLLRKYSAAISASTPPRITSQPFISKREALAVAAYIEQQMNERHAAHGRPKDLPEFHIPNNVIFGRR